MLTGDVPRGLFKLPTEKRPELDPAFDLMVARALDEDRGERYQTIAELQRDLLMLRHQPPRPRTAARKAAPYWIAAALVAIGATAIPLWRPREKPATPPVAPQPARPTPPSEEEIRRFAEWGLRLPPAKMPGDPATRLPDLLLARAKNNLRTLPQLPAEPLRIVRFRTMALPLNDATRPHLDVLGRLPELTDLRAYAVESPEAFATLRHLPMLVSLTLNAAPKAPPLSDDQLVHLAAAGHLGSLRLEGWSGLTGRGLAHLGNYDKLYYLSLLDCPDLDDDGLAEIARFPNLRTLHLACGARVTDAGLAHLAALPQLHTLRISFLPNAGTDGAGLGLLKQIRALHLEGAYRGEQLRHLASLTALEELQCIHNPTIDDSSLAALGGLAKLQTLRLDDTRVTGTGLGVFPPGHGLTGLRLDDSHLSDEGVRTIARTFLKLASLTVSHSHADGYSVAAMVDELARLPRLTSLTCSYGFRDADLAEIARLRGLRRLSLASSSISNAGLAALAPLEELSHLDLAGLKIDDRCLPALTALRSLTSLDLASTGLSKSGIAELKRALPRCTVKD
jgi:hypothetical protein